MLSAALERLSEESRFKRFLGPKPRFTRAELAYLTEVDGIDHIAYVALRGDAPKELIAVGRMVRAATNPAMAEIAVVVGGDCQRRGLGRLPGDHPAVAARAGGVRWLTAKMAADNEPPHRLFGHISSQLTEHHAGPVDELRADLLFAA